MVRYLVALALGMHGVGHALLVANAWGYWRAQSGRAWLFADILRMPHLAEGLVGLLWIMPLVGFVAATGSLLAHDARWAALAIASAISSSILVLIWWNGLNTSSAFFALVFNLAVLAVLRWRPELLATSEA